MAEHLQEGRAFLVRITGKDFGYDLQAWHNHLKDTRAGGYTYGRNIVLPRIMQAALSSPTWNEAVQSLSNHGTRPVRGKGAIEDS